ncbi:MAG: SpoIIE family protein phosphatase [Archangiaceae bacterium]|nr:SpoIIE family protein phosphatase [Archangiaceae bacterium]
MSDRAGRLPPQGFGPAIQYPPPQGPPPRGQAPVTARGVAPVAQPAPTVVLPVQAPPAPVDVYRIGAPAQGVDAAAQVRSQVAQTLAALQQLPLNLPGVADEPALAHGSEALGKLEGLYADGKIEPSELGPLTRSALAIDEVLAIRDTGAVEGLPPALRQRLDAQLFDPLAQLSRLARRHADRGLNAQQPNPASALLERLSGPALVHPQRPGPEGLLLTRSGGAETDGVEVIQGQFARAAVFTDKGHDYKSYNEDAAGAGAIGRTSFIITCDQAGGMGNVPGKDGAASALGASALEYAARWIDEGHEPHRALGHAADWAHSEIQKLNAKHQVMSITTLSGVVVRDRVAHVINCGDSQVLHFSRDGRLKNAVETDNIMALMVKATGRPNAGIERANQIDAGLGTETPPPYHLESWPLEPGDYLVTITDGVLDANLSGAKKAIDAGRPFTEYHEDLTRRDLGTLLAKSATPEQATADIATYALRQVLAGDGKGDNLGVAVLQVA